MTLKEMLKTVTPEYVTKLDDSKLKRLNSNLHLANTLSRVEKRPLIEKVQKYLEKFLHIHQNLHILFRHSILILDNINF